MVWNIATFHLPRMEKRLVVARILAWTKQQNGGARTKARIGHWKRRCRVRWGCASPKEIKEQLARAKSEFGRNLDSFFRYIFAPIAAFSFLHILTFTLSSLPDLCASLFLFSIFLLFHGWIIQGFSRAGRDIRADTISTFPLNERKPKVKKRKKDGNGPVVGVTKWLTLLMRLELTAIFRVASDITDNVININCSDDNIIYWHNIIYIYNIII